MTTPISDTSLRRNDACYEPHDESLQCEDAPHRSEPNSTPRAEASSAPPDYCSVACSVASSVVCAGVGFGASVALSPTVAGAAAGAAIGLDCGLIATVTCGQICAPERGTEQ